MRLEVMHQLGRIVLQLQAGVREQDARRHAEQRLQAEHHLRGADPLPGAHERGGLVTDRHQGLLDLSVGGDGDRCVALVPISGAF